MTSTTCALSTNINRLDQLLRERAASHANVAFLEVGDRRLTFADVDLIADFAAAKLSAAGVSEGDRVVVFGENSERFVIAAFAVMRTGAAFVPVSPRITNAQLKAIVSRTNPCAVIAVSDALPRNPEVFGDTPLWSMDALLLQECRFRRGVEIANQDLTAVIIYTSGSTGIPRGVVCPHRAILAAVRGINQLLSQSSEDRILCALPFSFDYGLYQTFLALDAGATLIIESAVSNPLALPAILKRKRISGFPLVPALAAMLLRSRLLERTTFDRLRYVTSTGDLLPTCHTERLRDLLPGTAVLPMYGLTECKRVAVTPYAAELTAPASVGIPLPGTRVEILEVENSAIKGAGELIVRGEHLMAGYFGEPEATLARFPIDPVTGERMLRTGDIFRQSASGYLYFLGRCDSLIEWRDRSWFAAPLEDALARIGNVTEAALVTSNSDKHLTLHAILGGGSGVDEITANEHVARVIDEGFDGKPPPWTMHVRGNLPKTIHGKIDRDLLSASVRNAL